MVFLRSRGGRLLTAAVLVALVGLAGCGDKVGQKVGEMNKTNIQRVTNLYEAGPFRSGSRSRCVSGCAVIRVARDGLRQEACLAG